MAREDELETIVAPVETSSGRETLASDKRSLAHLPVGSELGRYLVLGLRGEGGMGVVYAAYDPNLDRKVALKLLLQDRADEASGARLLREAQALAKLAHPNVVAVHDAGVIGECVFIEMEYVEGDTLEQWAKDKPWRAVIDAYAAAGRALAAAHAASIVHRDFKGTNAIVDASGRVRVLDFGLARTLAPTTTPGLAPSPGSSLTPPSAHEVVRAPALDRTVAEESRDGFIAGTPAYMAPEQWQGKPLDARADQYAFAASLHESLYGQLPFPKASRASMRTAETRGAIASVETKTGVPDYVRKAIVRALSFSPDDRFPSMNALIHALTHDPAADLRRRVVTSAIVVSLLALVVLLVRHERMRGHEACADLSSKLAGTWDERVASSVHASLVAGHRPGAEEAWDRTKKALDAQAHDWLEARTSACEDARKSSANEGAIGARLVCLDHRASELRALTTMLATEPGLVEEAARASASLSPVAACAGAGSRRLVLPPDSPKTAREVEALRTRLLDVETRRLAGRAKEARPAAVEIAEAATKLGYRPFEALALFTQGKVESEDGVYDDAVKTLERATWAAEAGGDDELVVKATTALALLVGYRKFDAAGGARWERHAAAALERYGDSDALLGELEGVRSAIARQDKRLPESLAHAEKSVELVRRAHGTRHRETARAEHNLANSYSAMNRWDDALSHYEIAHDIDVALFGETHPDSANAIISEAILLRKRGDLDGAIRNYEKALAILEPVRGAGHPDVALAENNLGLALLAAGRLAEARARFEHALVSKRKVYGDRHPLVASTLVNLARIDRKEERYAEARAKLESALAMDERTSETGVITILHALTELSLAEQSPKQARVTAERALALNVKRYGEKSAEIASSLALVAKCYLASGDTERALPLAERAMSLSDAGESRAHAEFLLAKVLVAAKKDRERADSLAASAETFFASGGDGSKEDAASIRSWRASMGAVARETR